MNGRRLFREYAQSRGKEAKEFIEIIEGDFYESDTLVTKSNQGIEEYTNLNYREMVHWIIKSYKNK